MTGFMVDASQPGDQDGTEALPRTRLEQPLPLRVRVLQGSAVPEDYLLSSGICRVGAGPDNELVIDDRAVSRSHLELRLVPEGVTLRDLGSRNGTFYLGQRVSEMTLAPFSRVTLGATELLFEPELSAFTAGAPMRDRYGALIGEAPAMRELFACLQRLEASLVNVLIEGESGTGKELVARALHDHSVLADKPFVAINCGALERSLARSELFGHKKGAFTGAVSDSSGAFQLAHGGTLFLDEVGELPLEIQPLLLRVLETGRCARVGESAERPVKVRVVAATHRSLQTAVEQGAFREDLYYRLVVVRLELPALRERPEDIPVLVEYLARQLGMAALPEGVVRELRQRHWPGNVRELKNAVTAYGAMGTLQASGPAPQGGTGGLQQLELVLREVVDVSRPYAEQKEELIERMTRIYLSLLLERTGGNRSEAARIAGLQRGYLRKLLDKLGVEA